MPRSPGECSLDQTELLRYLVDTFEQLQIRYMLVGSLASGAYGEPRMTQDIDVVVDAKEEQVGALCDAFGSKAFHVSRPAPLEAARRGGSSTSSIRHRVSRSA